MGSVRCRKCDAKVKKDTEKCKHCGLRRPGRFGLSWGAICVIGLFIAIATCIYLKRGIG